MKQPIFSIPVYVLKKLIMGVKEILSNSVSVGKLFISTK